MSYVLFFSFNDDNSKRLCEAIVKTGIGPAFKYANIDDRKIRENRPKNITKIPTILEPNSGRIFVGEDAFSLVKSIIQRKQGASQNQERFANAQPPQARQMAPNSSSGMATQNRMPQAIQPRDNNPQMKTNMLQQPTQKSEFNITNQPVDYDSVIPQLSGGPAGTGVRSGKISSGKSKSNMVGANVEGEEIAPFMPTEMCNGVGCYGFLDNTEIHGGFYYLDNPDVNGTGAQGSGAKSSSGLQYNPNIDTPSQQYPELPSNLQAVNAKVSKNGNVDMSRELERFTQQRTGDFSGGMGNGMGMNGMSYGGGGFAPSNW
jgi:hypothetical protein